MKILIVSDYFNKGGVSYVIYQLAKEWNKNHELSLLFFEKTPLAYDDICNNAYVEFINTKALTPIRFLNKLINKIIYKCAIKKKIKQYKPDIMISFKTKPNLFTLLANKNIGIKHIICEHGFHLGEKSKKTNRLRRKLYPLATYLSVLTREDFKYYSFVKNKIIMPNPLGVKKQIHTNDKKNIILYAGRLEEEKAVDVFIKALSCIQKDVLNKWKIIVAGEGSLKKNLMELAKNLNLHIDFVGYIEDLSFYYEKAKILCLCSKQEGLPIVLIEAAFYECARISSDYMGVNELIDDKNNGLLFKMDDFKDMALKISLLMQDENLRQEIVKKAKEKVESYKVESVMKKWDELFIEVLGKGL
ncbi:glycosyltransferase [Campylobacter jejuni]|uniref:glycosyltransferase n=3 Tax=Campylobacter TaxID=194 RepID=UPI0008748DB3|nr:glycosyltransferase [Campylobacter sp. BCW_4332]EHD2889342.1 glycosyltransferase family 4 protein [Campylobacter jejuni]OEW74950.1 GalNAc alpha-1,4-transferase [Campylobacter sp. BCW_4332]HAA2044396.1 glycosyltransferase family 4 protein [Campylobacter jejuni]